MCAVPCFRSRIVRGLLRPVMVITACCVGEPRVSTPTTQPSSKAWALFTRQAVAAGQQGSRTALLQACRALTDTPHHTRQFPRPPCDDETAHCCLTGTPVPLLLSYVCRCLLSAAAVAAYHTLHNSQVLPAWMPAMPIIPIEPFQLTSFALSLLLVFRTNSSYSRWYEGRRRFGRITTTCRDVLRQVRRLACACDTHTSRDCQAYAARKNKKSVTACIRPVFFQNAGTSAPYAGDCIQQSCQHRLVPTSPCSAAAGYPVDLLLCADAGADAARQPHLSVSCGALADRLLPRQQVVHQGG